MAKLRLRQTVKGVIMFIAFYGFIVTSFMLLTKLGYEIVPIREMDGVGNVGSLQDRINIITATDSGHIKGAPALINSILKTSKSPDDIMIHIVMCDAPEIVMKQYLGCYGIKVDEKQIKIVRFDETYIDPEMAKIWDDSFFTNRLRSTCNYARNYFYRLFPDVNRAIYLDIDAVVNRPIEELWSEAMRKPAPLLAVKNQLDYNRDHFQVDKVTDMFQSRYGRMFNSSASLFNGGVFVLDLEFYRKYNLIDDVEFWLKENDMSDPPLYRYESQSIMQIIYHGLWQTMDEKWNVKAVGLRKPIDEDIAKTAGVLHWVGTHKPWLEDGANRAYWERYLPLECSMKGRCIETFREDKAWKCACENGRTGTQCQYKIGIRPQTKS
ncbi:uncharacterized protein LOC100374688 [Saccoglossus kowalevskii]|uniref:Probable galacturonosyltransferase 5-like n=1 Tax=Saccoglossus kowalevskii TaxID=10224 RepID=A0ABM0GT81_SACKO|nr:PREDICTED: probable galacturonosyltransferase 5-like [Saccoglossus kowalevskii]